jgi:biotin carboxyl carrier protein
MKIMVKIDGDPFDVEIGNLYERPVIARVDGLQFEVWPEGEEAFKVKTASNNGSVNKEAISKNNSSNGSVTNTVTAPIPGMILDVHVEEGDKVVSGQELCILEAMKMKNTIRSPRSGCIAGVKVHSGQQVAEGDVLVVFV